MRLGAGADGLCPQKWDEVIITMTDDILTDGAQLLLSDLVSRFSLSHAEIYRAVSAGILPRPRRRADRRSTWTNSQLASVSLKTEDKLALKNDATFQIIEIDEDEIDAQEQLGSKQKFWCQISGSDSQWLFKFSQEHTGQHWSEKVAAEIADLVSMQHAQVELAIFDGCIGSIGESIARNGRELFHGNQLLGGLVTGYDRDATYKHRDHTVTNIVSSLQKFFVKEEGFKAACSQLFGYFLFDALIGNTDRHHENWAISYRKGDDETFKFIAPSFDHASSLGRELRDESSGRSRKKILQNKAMESYARRSYGAIYISENDRKAATTLGLAAFLIKNYRSESKGMYDKICSLEVDDFVRIIENVPNMYMSDVAKEFANELLKFNLKSLKDIAA